MFKVFKLSDRLTNYDMIYEFEKDPIWLVEIPPYFGC